MRVEPVEIYSDALKAQVLRAPGGRFPGVLIPGETLHTICVDLDKVIAGSGGRLDQVSLMTLLELRDTLWDRLEHYRDTLIEHNFDLPFDDSSPAD